MNKVINALMRWLGYMPTPKFPQAGVGSGGIFYRVLGPRHIRVLLASRAGNVGAGSGISFGGWMPLSSLLGKLDGTLVRTEIGAAREGVQEVPGLLKTLSKDVLLGNLQYLLGGCVYKPNDPYGNIIHAATYYGLAVTEAEEEALCNLPKSKETTAPLMPVDLSWTVDNPTPDDLKGLPGDFHHGHEREAFAALAQLADQGRLWTDRKEV